MAALLLCLSLLIAAVQFSTVDSALPCDSPLRKYLPQDFAHCPSCSYGQWSPWRRSIPLQVTSQTCDSGKAKKFERSRTAVPGSTCTPNTVKKYKYECEPTLRQKAVLIIWSLRLGVDADGNQSTTSPTIRVTRPPPIRVTRPPPRPPPIRVTRPPPIRVTRPPPIYVTRPPIAAYITCSDGTRIRPGQTCPPYPTTPRFRIFTTRPPTFTTSRFRIFTTPRPTRPNFTTFRPFLPRPIFPFRGKRQTSINYCPTASRQANNRICPNVCARGKRSIEEKEEFTMVNTPELQSLDKAVPVEPFNMEERVNTISERRRRQTCTNADTRHVLFIVDTSGSIGRSTFNKVKNLLASISEKLCDRLRVAMITYSSEINLEFCFNCTSDRREIFNAIRRVQYRGGSTYTTDATKCACQTMLTEECGLPRGSNTPNIDIVYLTDGRHNGPCTSNLKSELYCLHSRRNINTYAIAIGSAALASVQAMENPLDFSDSHIFNVDNVSQLDEIFKQILLILNARDSDGDPVYTCFSHNRPCSK